MTPMSQLLSDGSQSSAPTIASEPRGSLTIAARQRSFLVRKTSSLCATVPPPRSGPPSRTSRVGSPPVWESRIAIRRGAGWLNFSAVYALGRLEDWQGRTGLQRLLDQRDNLGSLLSDQRQSRWAHGFAAHPDDALHELDVLNELSRHVEMQEWREPAIYLSRFLHPAVENESVDRHGIVQNRVNKAGHPAASAHQHRFHRQIIDTTEDDITRPGPADDVGHPANIVGRFLDGHDRGLIGKFLEHLRSHIDAVGDRVV